MAGGEGASWGGGERPPPESMMVFLHLLEDEEAESSGRRLLFSFLSQVEIMLPCLWGPPAAHLPSPEGIERRETSRRKPVGCGSAVALL